MRMATTDFNFIYSLVLIWIAWGKNSVRPDGATARVTGVTLRTRPATVRPRPSELLRLLHPELGEEIRVVEGDVVQIVVASARSAVTCGHVGLEHQLVVIIRRL